jgi:dihydroorotate dehydrogenase electron transfer subunit
MKSEICKIIKNEKLTENFYLLKIENKFKERFLPGNFVHIKIENNFLRRPFSVAKYTEKSIIIIYKVVGTGTYLLSKKKKNDSLDVLGPIGNSFPVFKNKKVALIGGGTGIAPLIFLSEELKKCRNYICFFYGVKSKNLIFFDLLPKGIKYIFSTDDGTFGERGDIFKVFKKYNGDFDILYGAGPEPLLEKITSYSDELKVYISLENYMACGMGLCYGCVVKIKENDGWEYKRVCKDGPVFDGKKVIWD